MVGPQHLDVALGAAGRPCEHEFHVHWTWGLSAVPLALSLIFLPVAIVRAIACHSGRFTIGEHAAFYLTGMAWPPGSLIPVDDIEQVELRAMPLNCFFPSTGLKVRLIDGRRILVPPLENARLARDLLLEQRERSRSRSAPHR